MIIIPSNPAGKAPVLLKGSAVTYAAAPASVTIPSHVAGDLIIGFATSEYGQQYTYPNPAGWTQIYQPTSGLTGNDASGMQVAYKVAQSSSETFGNWGSSANCVGAVVLAGQHGTTPIGAKSTYYWNYPAATSVYFTTVTPADTSGISSLIQLGHLTNFGNGSAFNTPITIPSGYTLNSSYNLSNGWGNGLIVASKNSSTSGEATSMANRTSGASGGRASGIQLEILAQGTTIPMVTYDAVGPGFSATTPGTYSFTHTATAGSSVIVAGGMYNSGTLSNVTYGGASMTLIGTSPSASGRVSLYYLANVPGGPQTVSFTTPDQSVINAISFKGVTSKGTPTFSAAGSTGSIAASANVGDVILGVYGFSVYPGTLTGGTLVYSYDNYRNTGSYGALSFAYATSSTTFSYSTTWNGVVGYLVLKPT